MKKLFPLFLVAMFLCWSLTFADIAPTKSSADVSYMPDLTTNFISEYTGEEVDDADISSLQRSDTPNYPLPDQLVCPSGTIFGQLPDGTHATNSDVDGGYKCFDDFTQGGEICDIHFWGLKAYFTGTSWVECSEDPMPFEITFYPDDGTGLPDTANPECTYTPVLQGTNTGETFAGFIIWEYNYTFPVCCTLATGWISIQGNGGDSLCWHLWISSGPDGSGSAFQFDGTTMNPLNYNLNMCLTGTGPTDLGACCNDNNGQCIDSVLLEQCPVATPGVRWVANTACANLQPPCGTIMGACCDVQGNCTQTTQQNCPGLWLSQTSCDPNPCPPPPPCSLVCPPTGIAEGEPDCYDGYVDNYNGGCNSTPNVFSPYTLGDTICGTAGNYTTNDTLYRDTDWYTLTITTDNMLYYYGVAEFDLQLLIIDAGSGDCVDYTVITSIVIEACSTGVVSTPVCPGTYWLWAGENDADLVACGSDYQIWAELGAPPTGACCVGTDCVATNTMCECDALQGNWYMGETCASFQCPILVNCDNAIWMNGLPTGGAVASQCEYTYAPSGFAAGTADDFVLPGTDSVTLEYVIGWAWFWNQNPPTNPASTPADLEGVNVTIYAHDPAAGAPGGKPLHPPDSAACSHVELIPDGIVYTTQLAQGSFGYLADDINVWRLMMPVDVTLDGGVTYWLEVEPIMQPFDPLGQVGSIPTDLQQGAFAMQIFELLSILVWTNIDPTTDVAFCLIEAPIGRCCYPDTLDILCADNTPAECAALNGTWTADLNCIDDPCPTGCDYVPGDVNGSDSYNGLDITFGVAYFKGGNPPMCPDCPPCNSWNYCGDVNGSCSYNGLDITYGVAYFKGGAGPIPCGDCPPNP